LAFGSDLPGADRQSDLPCRYSGRTEHQRCLCRRRGQGRGACRCREEMARLPEIARGDEDFLGLRFLALHALTMALEGTDAIRELAQRLFDAVQAYADDRHVRYDDRATKDLWAYAQKAAADIAKEADTGRAEREKEAQRNFETL